MEKIDKNKIIQEELDRFYNIYKNIDENKKIKCQRLFEEAAYLYATMRECKQLMDETGIVEVYNNGGGQTGLKQNPASKYYLDCSKHYNSTIKQINEYLAEEEESETQKTILDNPILSFASLRNNKGE